MNTQLTQSQVQQVAQIIGNSHGHTHYNNTHYFFIFNMGQNLWSIFSQIQALGLQVVIAHTWHNPQRQGNNMLQIAVVPQQITV